MDIQKAVCSVFFFFFLHATCSIFWQYSIIMWQMFYKYRYFSIPSVIQHYDVIFPFAAEWLRALQLWWLAQNWVRVSKDSSFQIVDVGVLCQPSKCHWEEKTPTVALSNSLAAKLAKCCESLQNNLYRISSEWVIIAVINGLFGLRRMFYKLRLFISKH